MSDHHQWKQRVNLDKQFKIRKSRNLRQSVDLDLERFYRKLERVDTEKQVLERLLHQSIKLFRNKIHDWLEFSVIKNTFKNFQSLSKMIAIHENPELIQVIIYNKLLLLKIKTNRKRSSKLEDLFKLQTENEDQFQNVKKEIHLYLNEVKRILVSLVTIRIWAK